MLFVWLHGKTCSYYMRERNELLNEILRRGIYSPRNTPAFGNR